MSVDKWISDEKVNSLVSLVPEGRDKQKACLLNIINSVNNVEDPKKAKKALKTAILDLVESKRISFTNKPHKKILGLRIDTSDKKFVEDYLLRIPTYHHKDQVHLSSSDNQDVFGDNWYEASEIFFDLILEGSKNILTAIAEEKDKKNDIYKRYS